MYTEANTLETYFSVEVPVSVTMEDDPKDPESSTGKGNGNLNGNDSDASEQQAGRLLQVTMAESDTEGKDNIRNTFADPTGRGASASARAASDAVDSLSHGIGIGIGIGADEDYILRAPNSATGNTNLEVQVERDLETLSEIERQQVYFDMRGEVFKADPRRTDASDTNMAIAADDATAPIENTFHSHSNSTTRAADTAVPQSELDSMNTELFRLLEDPEEQLRNPAYQNIANTLSSNAGADYYPTSLAFRTKLLRAAHRNFRKGAKRTANYLALLWESFGEQLLSRPIKLSDLSLSERQLQRKGYQQLFRFRDQSQYRRQVQKQEQQHDDPSNISSGNSNSGNSGNSNNNQTDGGEQELEELDTGEGRRIAGSFDLCRCISTNEPAVDDELSKVRVLLYLMQAASNDEETQMQGIVFIFMLALRAVLNASLPPSCPPATTTLPPIIESQPPTSEATQAQQESSGTASLPRKDSTNNIFANDSPPHSDSSDNNSDDQLLAQLQFSPHERSNRHNHTLSRVKVLSKVFRCGPVRVGAIHVCSPSRPELQQIKFDFLKALDRHERVRTRFHNGTSMECSLSLSKVGIPTDRLPLKYDGTVKTEDHLQWIAIQEAKELAAKHSRPFNIVECPMNMDVLSGRGQLVRSHPGNISFRTDFIRARSARYDRAANREEKNAIAEEILEDISTLRRRFLKQHQGAGYWTELDKKTSKEKVMMAFREFRKSQRNQQQQQTLQQIRKAQQQQPGLRSLQHSPVTHPPAQSLRKSLSMSPSNKLSMSQKQSQRGYAAAHAQQAHAQAQADHRQMEHHQQSDEYQYPPHPSAIGSVPQPPSHYPQHHMAVSVPPAAYYLPHPPIPLHPHSLAYGHPVPIPPHLLHIPPPSHPFPLQLHNNPTSRGNSPPNVAPGINPPDEAAAAAAAVATMGYNMGGQSSQLQVPPAALAPYNQIMAYPPGGYLDPRINPERGRHNNHNIGGGVGEVEDPRQHHSYRPPSRQRGNSNVDDVDGDPNNDRRNKRYRMF